MRIGEISTKTGLSKDTIRFYEKKGLIQVGRTESEWNNYKNYSEDSLKRLLLIKKAKSFGFTLNEISEILTLYDTNEANCATMAVRANAKIEEIDLKIKELIVMKKILLGKYSAVENGCLPLTDNSNCPTLVNE